MRFAYSLAALGAVGALASTAGAAVSFTYADPPGSNEVVYTAPLDPGDDGVVTVDTIVDLQVDLSDHGLGVHDFFGVHFVKQATVGPATEVAPGIFSAESIDCTFSYTTSGGDFLLGGSYSGGNLVLVANSGSLTANITAPGGLLAYSYGQPMLDLLFGSGLVYGPAIDAVWTLTNVSNVAILPSGYFDSFTSNAAFTGTAQIVPTPGALALGLFSCVTAYGRRSSRR